MYLPSFETERLIIRPLTMDDIPAWEENFYNNYFLEYVDIPVDCDATKESTIWIERQLNRYNNGLYGLMALVDKQTNALIGQCGWLKQEVDGVLENEIGYHILPKLWGKGHAIEAASAFKQKAKEHQISDTVISIIDVKNIRSQRVAEKNGMKREKQTLFRGVEVYIYRVRI